MRGRFFLVCLGCPKNEVDTEGMATLLQNAGWRQAAQPESADLIIVNTCGFIRPAREESYEVLLELARSKRKGQRFIAVGCLAQLDPEGLRLRVPELDGTLGTRDWSTIVEYVATLSDHSTDQRVGAGTRPTGSLVTPVQRRVSSASAYIKIADGCSASCAFCAIPRIKGPQCSKDVHAVLTEARELVGQQVREIILIAQDTTAYGRDRGEHDALPQLIEDILEVVPELTWLRILYAYPHHLSERLIELLASRPQLCHYLDLPLQHAHPDTLRRMNRPHDVERVHRLIGDLRHAVPDIALRTTFIVGFPGETDEEFEMLLSFMSDCQFDRVGIFVFSPEDGTAAAVLPNRIPPQLAQERYEEAMALQQRISYRRNQAQVDRVLQVLVEGTQAGLSVGRSYRDAPEIDGYVLVRGRHPVGQVIEARITRALEYDLEAEPAG